MTNINHHLWPQLELFIGTVFNYLALLKTRHSFIYFKFNSVCLWGAHSKCYLGYKDCKHQSQFDFFLLDIAYGYQSMNSPVLRLLMALKITHDMINATWNVIYFYITLNVSRVYNPCCILPSPWTIIWCFINTIASRVGMLCTTCILSEK